MKKIIFWIPDIDKVYKAENPIVAIGGANIQMALWAKLLAKTGYKTYAFTDKFSRLNAKIYNVKFLYFPLVRYVMWALNPIKILWLFIVQPDWVVVRTNFQELSLILLLRKVLKFKVLYMLASDKNVILNNGHHDKLQQQILSSDYVIAQNDFQRKNFYLNFKKKYIPIIPNIWDNEIINKTNYCDEQFDFIWVSNIRPLKRPHWFIDLAKHFPKHKFGLIGANMDNDLYIKCTMASLDLQNLRILGKLNFHKTTKIIQNSKILVCTSEFEGFPNTFLQAWQYGIPVLSTVNPNQCISKYNLGFYVQNQRELRLKAIDLISETENYKKHIIQYFEKHHLPETMIPKFIESISG